jgi:exo-beta-1,3-glucanase (GH17 family)
MLDQTHRFSSAECSSIAPRSRELFYLTPLALLLVSLSTITAVWWWLATPVTLAYAPIDSATKLDCVSYAPFRGHQSPWNSTIVISREQIAEDLAELARISRCVRIYSVENGLDKVPEIASKVGLKVILGVWIGRDRLKNAQLIETAISLIKDNPGVITAMIVGSEVLLRGEMTASDLRETIRSVKARVKIPVSYADVWEFWLRYRDVSEDVDFVTVHMLPYWEDFPVRAEDAAAHVDDIRKRMVVGFPGKEILIGEAGWPSQGRMRGGALPSRIYQARFVSELLHRARQEDFRVNLFEAFDEPWKREWEGTVGGHWGLLDGESRKLKYAPGAAVTNYPFWKLQLGCGLVLCISVFGLAVLALRRQRSTPQLASWIAVAASATVCGTLFGVITERTLDESDGLGGGLAQAMLLAAGIAAPALCSDAYMSGRALPTFLDLIGPREGRTRSLPTMILGFTLMVTTLLALQSALGLVFDPRWRDFPFASLTMAVVPFWILTLVNHQKRRKRSTAEAVFASLFAVAALYILFNEGSQNWQAVWTCVMYFMLSTTLWQPRSVVALEASLYGAESSAFQPVAAATTLEPRQ